VARHDPRAGRGARAAGQPITLLQGDRGGDRGGFVRRAGRRVVALGRSGRRLVEHFDELVSRSASVPVPLVLSLLLVLAACLIVAPIAVYLATADFES
jgi:hypothetical protein